MQVFPASRAEPAERFTRLTSTAVRGNKTTPAKTVKTAKTVSLCVRFSAVRHFGVAQGTGVIFNFFYQSIS